MSLSSARSAGQAAADSVLAKQDHVFVFLIHGIGARPWVFNPIMWKLRKHAEKTFPDPSKVHINSVKYAWNVSDVNDSVVSAAEFIKPRLQ